jgi:hypothetical protein
MCVRCEGDMSDVVRENGFGSTGICKRVGQ